PRLRNRSTAGGAQGPLARGAGGRRVGGPPRARHDLVSAVDRSGRAPRRDARNSRPVTLIDGSPYLLAALWAIVGGGAGWVVRWGSVRLARMEGLEPGHRRWQEFGPPLLCALVITPFPLLLIRSVFALVLAQVVFFDFEHRLILDRVMFPAMALALLVSLSPLFASGLGLWHQPWWFGILMGLIAGVLFLALALAGSAIFKAEALGFGDVKLAVFM